MVLTFTQPHVPPVNFARFPRRRVAGRRRARGRVSHCALARAASSSSSSKQIIVSDAFHWHLQLPQSKTYAGRAEECRCLAKVCPEHLRESYLELAAAYDQLANEAEPKL
jgi:hypothetical protein